MVVPIHGRKCFRRTHIAGKHATIIVTESSIPVQFRTSGYSYIGLADRPKSEIWRSRIQEVIVTKIPRLNITRIPHLDFFSIFSRNKDSSGRRSTTKSWKILSPAAMKVIVYISMHRSL